MAFSPSRSQWIAVVLGAAVLGGGVGGVVGMTAAPALREPLARFIARSLSSGNQGSSTTLSIPPIVTVSSGIAEDEQSIAVVSRVEPAVVSIIISKDISQVFPAWAVPGRSIERIGGGSGFFVSSDGLIVTNKHVVEDEEASYTVVTRDGKKLPVTSIVRDPVLDLAVLRVEGTGFATLEFADSSELNVGQTVLAIGNALDEFRNTVTKGIISGLHRRIAAEGGSDGWVVLDEAIQTDAAINPGNSGGPLIDLHGRVVGVNTAISGDGQLIGFALPANVAKRAVEQVRARGSITRPFIGIRYLVVDELLVEEQHLPVDHGVLISRGETIADLAVIPGSPADKAGLKENDILLFLNGTPITPERTLGAMMGEYQPGDVVTFRVYREGKEFDLSILLGEYASET